ncbi:MAG: stage III sporulation protein AE [Oscillospiraceae bacterium]
MRWFAVVLLCLQVLSQAALADGEMAEDIGLPELQSAIPDEAAEIYGDLTPDTDGWEDRLDALWEYVLSHSGSVLKQGIKSAVAIVTILLLCSAAGSISGGKTPDFVPLGGALGIAAVASGDVSAFVGLGEKTLRTLQDFATILLPCIAAASAAAGNVSAGSAGYAATALFMDILITLCSAVIMPLIYIYIAAVTARAALGTDALSAAVSLTKWMCVTVMTALVTVFTAYLSITGAVASGSDAAVAKLAKSAISAALPVVGGIVSGAAGTVVAGASMLRAGVGVFGMLVVLAVCAGPFLTLCIHYLIYKGVAALGMGLADSRLGQLIDGIGTAFGMVLGLVGCGAIMLFFALLSGMKAVSPL